jgi:hypothetical protein
MARGKTGKDGINAIDLLTDKIEPPGRRSVHQMRLTPFGTHFSFENSPELLDYLRKISERRAQLQRVPLAPELKTGREAGAAATLGVRRTFNRAAKKDHDLGR